MVRLYSKIRVEGLSLTFFRVTVVPGVQQGSTNFLLSALEIKYPNASVLTEGWFAWLLTSIGMLVAMARNIYNPKVLQWYFRFAIAIFFTLFLLYWIWFPIKASGHFQSTHGALGNFYNGINEGTTQQASDSYCWIISILFGAWVFYGYDTSAHLAEETLQASEVVAKGMYISTFSAWFLSVPTLVLILFCLQDFEGIISATYTNNWAEYLVQVVGPNGAVAILSLLWVDSTCATASCIMSAQRVTYAISRDHVLPGSKYFRRLSSCRMAVNAALLVYAISVAVTTAVIGSTVAFSAITATATIATNTSYLFPMVARHTVGRKSFKPARWNLGKYSPYLAFIASGYIMLLFIVLLLPQLYPVDGVSVDPYFNLLQPSNLNLANPELCSHHDWRHHADLLDRLDFPIWLGREVLVQRTAEDNHGGGAGERKDSGREKRCRREGIVFRTVKCCQQYDMRIPSAENNAMIFPRVPLVSGNL